MKQGYIYILTNSSKSSLYIGVTNDLERRIYEHKNRLIPGFTKKYNTDTLVYFEETSNIADAILREKQLKNWHKEWKVNLINSINPEWNDLYPNLLSGDPETSSGGHHFLTR